MSVVPSDFAQSRLRIMPSLIDMCCVYVCRWRCSHKHDSGLQGVLRLKLSLTHSRNVNNLDDPAESDEDGDKSSFSDWQVCGDR